MMMISIALSRQQFYLIKINYKSSLDLIVKISQILMKAFYPLKRSDPANFVEPVVKYLEQVESQQKAAAFRQVMNKITQLRNKVTSLSYDEPSLQVINKFIPAVQMYLRFALLMSKHLNWNKDYGITVDDLQIVWYDSFNPSLKFMKNEIHFDIFCCFYNLGIMYFYKSLLLSQEDLNNSKKESMKCAKSAYYLFNRMRTYYYAGFVSTGFSDTDYSNLEILESMSQGIFYKNLFNMYKEDEYKLGIDKIASLAGLAQKQFFHAYEVANAYFMKSSNIKAIIKTEILSFAYVESLYHDLMFNTRLAKYYQEEMDKDKGNIIFLIAYQRKALRLLELGLNNQVVAPLWQNRQEEKKDLMNIKPQLENSLKTNVERNKQIYKKQEIKEENIPPPKEPPQQYLVKLQEPDTLQVSYDGPMNAPFAQLIDNESKGFMNDLKQFAKNRLNGLQSSLSKLNKNVETIYNDNFVNFYLNLENNNKSKGLPEGLTQKLNQIRMNGGKEKLGMEVKILLNNSEQAKNGFKECRKLLQEEENYYRNKSSQYGNRWRVQPSNQLNRQYYNEIEVFEKKHEVAEAVNKKIIEKYHSLVKYIEVCGGNEQQLMSVLPKVEVTKFIEENRGQFDNLKKGVESVKQKKEGLDVIVEDIRRFYEKMNFSQIASKYYQKINETNREQILEEIFSGTYKLISAFNEKSQTINGEAKAVGEISASLNQRNKGDQRSKQEFEEVVNKFNQINSLFRELGQGTAFYTKLSDVLVRIGDTVKGYCQARRMEADELEASLGKGGGGGNTNQLPSMYPNQPQQNLGFYVPPPMVFNQMPQQPMMSTFGPQQTGSMADMLGDLMRSKPNFSADVFGGKVYQSKFT